ncbi:hypothetical protein FS837_003883 [Tulasnella sp. UAMH 9824]|nr:hypothetical protein FS837_003883 [Tulasnella sp. UAMH 9824]
MLARATIPLTLLFAGAAIADLAHEARELTTEVVIPVTDNGITRFTTITSVYTAPLVPNKNADIPTNTLTPIDTSTPCYCYIPVTTTTADIHTLTIHQPAITTTTYTEFPLTTTICPCGLNSTSYVPGPTVEAGSIPTTQSAAGTVPNTHSVAAAAQETSGSADRLFLNANGAVPGVPSVRWAGVATFFGFAGAAAIFL